ncbi:hypothetical protein EDC94DRAFT_264871 [Helicostylum pulchrum]|nr:hypothetical protein EDC94DRAFT_264871 [Helicostylum pulchrum]
MSKTKKKQKWKKTTFWIFIDSHALLFSLSLSAYVLYMKIAFISPHLSLLLFMTQLSILNLIPLVILFSSKISPFLICYMIIFFISHQTGFE